MEIRARYFLMGIFVVAVTAAVFGFIYWLHAGGGLSARVAYGIRFDNTVAGLRAGSAVLFNGMRVGEVTDLRIDLENPRQVLATVMVDRKTPVRADTQVDIEVQGLMGAPSVALKGGEAGSSPLIASGSQAPTLVATPAAGQDTMQAAREALRRLNEILNDNADPFKGAIANINTFSGALARNSDRLDNILQGLERMTAGPGKASVRVYELNAPETFAAAKTLPAGQIVVTEPTTVIALDTQRIVVESDSGEAPSFPDVQWSDNIPKLVQARILQGFENAGFAHVARPLDGFAVDYQLLLDIRKFNIVVASKAVAQVEFGAKLLDNSGHIVGARVFRAVVPVEKPDNAQSAVAALNGAFVKAATEIVQWALSVS
jgi:phospholipid/cholesterol/gamma-HCH transport system substrate-binding protein